MGQGDAGDKGQWPWCLFPLQQRMPPGAAGERCTAPALQNALAPTGTLSCGPLLCCTETCSRGQGFSCVNPPTPRRAPGRLQPLPSSHSPPREDALSSPALPWPWWSPSGSLQEDETRSQRLPAERAALLKGRELEGSQARSAATELSPGSSQARCLHTPAAHLLPSAPCPPRPCSAWWHMPFTSQASWTCLLKPQNQAPQMRS